MPAGTFVYVSNAESKDILVFELDSETGDLAPVQQVMLSVPGRVMPLAVSPDRRFLYAAQRGEPYSVAAFAIDGSSGRLSLLGFAPIPHSAPYIFVDRTGRWLLLASYGGALVSVSPIAPQGIPQPPHQIIRTEAAPHSIQVDASNRHVFVPSLGGDVVLQWRFDGATGKLSANTPPTVKVSAGHGPRHFAFHPNNRTVYLLNERSASIYVFSYDAPSGTLRELETTSALQPDFSSPAPSRPNSNTNGGHAAADIHVTPDGRFVYASERTTSTLASFAADLATGRLTKLASFATEESPRSFNIDPTGRYLLAAGQKSHHLTVYGINQATGELDVIRRYPMGKTPNWVEIHRLP